MFNRCRWSSKSSEPFLFVKYDKNKLNIIDAEKQDLILNKPLEFEDCKSLRTYIHLLIIHEDWILGIDACPTDGNLLALAGARKLIYLYDKRQSEIVNTFKSVQSG